MLRPDEALTAGVPVVVARAADVMNVHGTFNIVAMCICPMVECNISVVIKLITAPTDEMA
jgi:hypothetical protein